MTTGWLFPHWRYRKSMNKCSKGWCANFTTYLLEKAWLSSHYLCSSTIFTLARMIWSEPLRTLLQNLKITTFLVLSKRHILYTYMSSVSHEMEDMIIMVSCMFIPLNLHGLEEKRARVKHENTREHPEMGWVGAKHISQPVENAQWRKTKQMQNSITVSKGRTGKPQQ